MDDSAPASPHPAYPARARTGTAGWTKKSWKGHFHPAGLPADRALAYTAERLTTIEINATFYGLRKPADYRKWAESTPPDFIFTVKGHGTVTRLLRMRTPRKHLAAFFASGPHQLGPKLGPLMWQLDSGQQFDSATLEPFLASLPHSNAQAHELVQEFPPDGPDVVAVDEPDRRIRHALEVRHPSFAAPEFVDLLQKYDVAAVFGPAPERTPVDALTSDFAYVRLHAGADHFPAGYDEAELERWAASIASWTDGSGCPDGRPRDVFAIFNNPDDDNWHPPFDAIHLQELLAEPAARGE